MENGSFKEKVKVAIIALAVALTVIWLLSYVLRGSETTDVPYVTVTESAPECQLLQVLN